jgi:hypothetical protein
MPRYTFTGPEPAILTDLIQGVNAHHVAAPGNPEVPEGTTVVAAPGDSVDTGDVEYLAFVLTDEALTPAPASSPPAVDESVAVDYTAASAPEPSTTTL